MDQTAAGTADDEEQQFTLRSEFARRTSRFASESNETQSQDQNPATAADIADIQETLKVIDSARRFVIQASEKHSVSVLSNDRGSNHFILRDMSKETLKLHNSSVSPEANINENDITQEVFKDDLAEVAQLRSNKSEIVMHGANPPGATSNDTSIWNQQRSERLLEIKRCASPLDDQYVDTAPSQRTDDLDQQNAAAMAERQHYRDGKLTKQNITKLGVILETNFIRIEQNSSVMNGSGLPSHGGQEDHSKLLFASAILPERDEESKHGYLVDSEQVASYQKSEVERGVGFGTAPSSQRETDQHLFGPGEALDPDALDADFAKLKENYEDHDRDRSGLYETGDASDAIRSISKACTSLVSGEKSRTIRTQDGGPNCGDEAEVLDQHVVASVQDESACSQVHDMLTFNDCSRVNYSLNRSQTAKDQLGSSTALSVNFSQPQTTANQSIQHHQEKSEKETVTSDVQEQIALRYDKIELANKLAEMTKNIADLQTTYADDSNKELSQKAKQPAPARASDQRSKSSSNFNKSRSPVKQIKPRAGKPRALKVAQKKAVMQQAVNRSSTEQSIFTVMDSSAEEQTFRPLGQSSLDERDQERQQQQQQQSYQYDFPLQKYTHNRVSSHTDLVEETVTDHEKDYYQERNQRREQEYREVVQKREKQPYQEYVQSLEEQSRQEVRHARFQQDQGQRHAHFSQPPPSRGRKQSTPKNEREESIAPKPEALPKLVTHESGYIDRRYFSAVSPTSQSGMLSGRTQQNSARFDNQGNLIPCLRSARRSRNNMNGNNDSYRGDINNFLSPRVPDTDERESRLLPIGEYRRGSHEPKSRLKRPHSYTLGPADSGLTSERTNRNDHDNNNFRDILTTSSNRFDRQDKPTSPPRGSHGGPSVQQFEHDLKQQKRQSDNRKVRTITGFENLHEFQQQQMHQTKCGAPLSTDRSRGAKQAAANGFSHGTQRSMGIESYCQNKERSSTPGHQRRAAAVQDRHDSGPRAVAVTGTGAAGADTYESISKIQQKSETLCEQLTRARNNRQDIEDNKTELLALKGENHKLKKALEQKDLALVSMRQQNGEQKKAIEMLKERVEHLETEVETVGDQNLFRKYKELQQQKENLAQKLAQSDYCSQAKEKGQELLTESYNTLKKNQIELVDMNKKLITSHQEEAGQLEASLRDCEDKLEQKSKKLERYMAIVKTFDQQIEMFESFEKQSHRDLETLQSQLNLYKDLFTNEKKEKEELITRMRPSLRPLHDSVKKQMAMQEQQQYQSAQQVQPFEAAIDNANVPMSSLAEGSSMDRRKSSQGNQGTKLMQTMSKNLSFGYPLQVGSSQSLKDQHDYNMAQQQVQVDSGRRNPHQIDLPLRILSETSSEGGGANFDKLHTYNKMDVRQSSHDAVPVYAANNNHHSKQQQDYPPLPRKQDSSMGRPVSNNHNPPTATTTTHYEQDNSFVLDGGNQALQYQINNYQTPEDVAAGGLLPRQTTWDHRNRSSSANCIGGRRRTNQELDDVSQDDRTTAMEMQQQMQYNPSANLDISTYSVNASRVDKVKLGLVPAGECEDQSFEGRHMSGCASAVINQRKLQFKTSRPASNNSNVDGKASKKATALERAKKQSMSSKDYYCKLKEMQRRLDRARNDIHSNVVQKSRSRSPVVTQVVQQQQHPHQQTQQSQQQPSEQHYSNKHGTSAGVGQGGRQINRQASNSTVQISNQTISFTETNATINDHSYQQQQQYATVQQQPRTANSGRSVDRKRDSSKSTNGGGKTRNRRSNGAAIPQQQQPQQNQQQQSMFYTSLYNGVQQFRK